MGIGLTIPPDLYATLVAVWREHVGSRSRARSAGPEGLTRDEMYAVSRRIRELSRGFTGNRSLAGERYLGDPGLLGAYLLHFWPISYCQASLCLEMMRRSGPFASALDVGAGPGPVSLALLAAGAKSVTACDRSEGALGLARRLATEAGVHLGTRQWDAQASSGMPRGPFDLVTLGHTLNELWAGHPDRVALRVSLLLRLAEQLSEGGRILFFDPALMETAQEAIRVRDGMVSAGFTVELPCIWQGACPALPSSTCHGEFDWEAPADMVRLAHMARIGRETLKMAWFVLRKPGPAARDGESVAAGSPSADSPDTGTYRVVSEPLLSKSGRIRYLVCGPLGRFALSAPKEAPGPGVKPFYTLRRGEGIAIGGARRRETGWGLEADSSVRVVERLPVVRR